MIVEIFGLSKTGKSIFMERLVKEKKNVLEFEKESFFKKSFFLSQYLLKHPITSFYLFYKLNSNHLKIKNLKIYDYLRILSMRNSYLAAVLSKSEMMQNINSLIFTDEFALQSIFMIFQTKTNERQIKKVMNAMPKSDFVFLFEKNREKRHEIYKKPHPQFKNPTMFPGGWINKAYAKSWMENMEFNYVFIKKIILEKYEEDKASFKNLNADFQNIYSIKKS